MPGSAPAQAIATWHGDATHREVKARCCDTVHRSDASRVAL